MKQQKARRRKKTSDPSKAWPLDLAFRLGKTAHTVSRKVQAAVTTVEKSVGVAKTALGRRSRTKLRARKGRVKILSSSTAAQISPIQKEIRDLFDISGFTEVIREMDEISHSSHPVIHRLLTKIKGLSPAEQDMLCGKFIERLNENPYFKQAMLSIPVPAKMTEEDSKKMSDALIGCFAQTLGDMGVPPEDQELLRKLSDEVMLPFNDLMQFYLKPKTFSQKMKRLWKLQRLFVKTIKLIHMTKSLAVPGENHLAPMPRIHEATLKG